MMDTDRALAEIKKLSVEIIIIKTITSESKEDIAIFKNQISKLIVDTSESKKEIE